ncbi:hypothetical protein LPJ63_000956 [Coemansia sp. RSA 2711]|nr:hypothetical protein LPJ63_000956 [Coemansia sp. RSA 2711]KAJ2369957.1 hypothetical protein H4S01_000683 [Coemansia sp. RSA 2610]
MLRWHKWLALACIIAHSAALDAQTAASQSPGNSDAATARCSSKSVAASETPQFGVSDAHRHYAFELSSSESQCRPTTTNSHQLATRYTALPTHTATLADEGAFASTEPPPAPSPSAAAERHRRDAKSLKDRFNYASADCAAVVLKANREARGLTAILNSKKDQYMLNECSARNKHVVIELCDDILLDTFVLGNYEFFSSTFKDLIVYVSDRYPPKDGRWTQIGHFQAYNSRDAQVFPVEDPKIWAKYIKIEFASHYGREFYCPLTVFKAYGATQMEQYRKEEEEEDLLEPATLTVDTLAGIPRYPLRLPYYQQKQPLRIAGSVSPAKAYLQDMQGLVNEYQVRDRSEPTPASRAAPMPRVPDLPWDQSGQVDVADDNDDRAYGDDEDDDDDDYEEEEDAQSMATPLPGVSAAADGAAQVARKNDGRSQAAADEAPTRGPHGPANRTQRGQESIFKTIMRRLSRVERNVTLAYHYLEEQHMIFNLVLQQVEMNNLETMKLAIDQLNHTSAKQMQSLTALSEEVWRAILYDLEEYQQKTQSEMGEMGSRLEFLAEEVLFEKRMNVAQLVLLLTIVAMIAVNKVVTKLALIPESKKEK